MHKKILFIILLFTAAFCYGNEKIKEKEFDNWLIRLGGDNPKLVIIDSRDETFLRKSLIGGSREKLEKLYNELNNEDDCNNLDLTDLCGYATARGIGPDKETGILCCESYFFILSDLEWDDED